MFDFGSIQEKLQIYKSDCSDRRLNPFDYVLLCGFQYALNQITDAITTAKVFAELYGNVLGIWLLDEDLDWFKRSLTCYLHGDYDGCIGHLDGLFKMKYPVKVYTKAHIIKSVAINMSDEWNDPDSAASQAMIEMVKAANYYLQTKIEEGVKDESQEG